MPNGVPKQNQFDAATRVMESDLLQVLTEKSSDVDDDSESDRSRGAALQIEVVVEQPVEGNVTTTNEQVAAKNDEKVGPPPLVAAPAASPTMATSPSDVAPERPPRRSRVFIVAGIVAAVVLAFDASLFVFHQNRAMRPATAAPAAPEPLPRYMLVPLDSPPPAAAGSATAKPAVTSTPATTPVVATVISVAPPPVPVHEHRHSHHRHASH